MRTGKRRGMTWMAAALVVASACGGGAGGESDEDRPATGEATETEAPEFNATGTAEVTVSGADSGTYELSFDVSEERDPPPGYFNVQWKGDPGQLFINGEAFTGTKKSGVFPNPSVLVGSAEHLYISDDDECSVTFNVAEPSRVEGTFECVFTEDDVKASGSFAAQT